ncbi:MAG: 2-amino-4-hydroxy-6-hydroxymethyldihydropteridine diphosphokinase [Acidiferrobacterales bacterium]
MPQVFVSIGSNIDREHHIRTAVAELRERGRLTLSGVYESAPIGFCGNNFYNLVVGFETDTPVLALCNRLAETEQRHGRVRGTNRFASRTLDLDLLLYGDLVRQDHLVQIPRPEIMQYAFVLKPLSELAPELRHPVTGISFGEMWSHFAARDQRIWPVTIAHI